MGFNTANRRQLSNAQATAPSTFHIEKRLSHRFQTEKGHFERIMAQNRIAVSVKEGSIRRQWTDFSLGQHVGDAFARISQMKRELVSVLGVTDILLSRQNGALNMRLHHDANHPVDLLDLLTVQSGFTRPTATLGLDDEGNKVNVDFISAENANVLIAGVEGAGKSSLLRSIAVSLALTSRQSAVQLVVFAPSESDRRRSGRRRVLYPMNYLPHLLFPVAISFDEVVEALEYLSEEALFRADEKLTNPKLIVLIDDVDYILAKGDQHIKESLTELLDTPKEAGIRIIMSASDVTSAELLRLVKFNIPLRLVGRMSDSDRAFLISGEPETGAENLNGSGDFLAITYSSTTRFQAAYIDDYDLHLTLTEMHRPRGKILLAQPLDPYDHMNEDILQFSVDEDSGDEITQEHVANISQRPVEDLVDLISLEELSASQESTGEGVSPVMFEQKVETTGPENSHLSMFIKEATDNSSKPDIAFDSKETDEISKPEAQTAFRPILVLTKKDDQTQSGAINSELEYDGYEDDWPLTGWDEDDSNRPSRHLH